MLMLLTFVPLLSYISILIMLTHIYADIHNVGPSLSVCWEKSGVSAQVLTFVCTLSC